MADSAKRRRALERQRQQRQQARRAERAARRRRNALLGGALALVVVVVGATLLATGVLGGEDETTASTGDNSQEDTDPASASGACAYREAGEPAVPDIGLPPELTGKAPKARTATLTLNGSPVKVQLESAAAPCTVHSFAFLAGSDYFDGTECHRLTTSDSLKVLQCGDPTGSGSGGPGYEFDNENTDGASYPAGTVAMANSGPDTNGSQFFLVYGDSDLPPKYTVFGHITDGLDVVTGIADAGTDNGSEDGAPAEPVTLDDVTTAAANLDEDSQ
ncbi:peptidyl-prolyl cis-trans isomerase B (cyclophilin B) [Haloactinopolyspora alba]|uniref:Peptidyl-prolyl cis-trans isomerase n=1 Tax=Haloactinopolyspora alba TaxID=648780 RepID=A0A2P8DIE0_9ACTN|nr:peptidylprolyl isomerase [Haloactinopolyspora alba]PSK96929.1 peptidyl-prolyl cis-trans isomerase B (cyclophilin B) [Haloactinopolyspora alba]